MKVKGRREFLFGWWCARRGVRRVVGGADCVQFTAFWGV
jgi:hypothetical protein